MSRRQTVSQVELQRWQTRKVEQDARDMEWLLSQPQGRRILYRIIYEVAQLETVNMSFDDVKLRYSEGMRHVGQLLLLEAKTASNADVVHMWSEALSERTLSKSDSDAENDEWKQEPPQ